MGSRSSDGSERDGAQHEPASGAAITRVIADNVTQLRSARGLSLHDLAAMAGVSRAAVSQLENCRSNPSLGLLHRVSAAFGMSVRELVVARTPDTVSLLRADAGEVLRSPDGRLEQRTVSPAYSSAWVAAIEVRLAPTASREEAHPFGTCELVSVLTGAVSITINDRTDKLQAGDSAFFPADIPHTYFNPGPTEACFHHILLRP